MATSLNFPTSMSTILKDIKPKNETPQLLPKTPIKDNFS